VLRGDNPVYVFGSLLEQGRFAERHFAPAFLNDPDPLTHHRAAATLRLTLFDRLQRREGGRQARLGVERADHQAVEARQRLLAEVVGRYFAVLVARARLDLAADAVATAEADAAATRDRFAQGLLVESDALAAEVQQAGLAARRIAAEGELAVARAALATTLRRPPGDPFELADELPPQVPAAACDETQPARAAERRASVLAAAAATAEAASAVTAARHGALPRVDAWAAAGAHGARFDDRHTEHALGASLSLDLFDPGRSSRVAAAGAALAAARAAESAARDQATLETVAACARLGAAAETIAVAARAVEQADAAARIVADRYQHGLATITDHLRARTAVVAARSELLAARHDLVVAHAERLRATGDLDDVPTYR
jgi:outer membrane protein TolC